MPFNPTLFPVEFLYELGEEEELFAEEERTYKKSVAVIYGPFLDAGIVEGWTEEEELRPEELLNLELFRSQLPAELYKRVVKAVFSTDVRTGAKTPRTLFDVVWLGPVRLADARLKVVSAVSGKI